MTGLKFAILEMLYNSRDRKSTIADVANSGLAPSDLIYDAVKDLKRSRYIYQPSFSVTLYLTDEGVQAFETAQESYQNQAKLNVDTRKDNRLSRIAKIVSIATAVITCIIALVNFIRSFF